jgi:hypothetical protein
VISVLVAFRDDPPGPRTETWDLIRERLERELPEVEICVGTDDSMPFNKSKALNRAAAQASGEVLLLTDSDTWIAPVQVHQAQEFVQAHPRRWVRAWNSKKRLDEETTAKVLGQGSVWDGTVPAGATFEDTTAYWAGPPLAMTRAVWDDVRGMDEGFDRGWGSEDAGLAFKLKVLHGKAQVLRGDAIHLFHPRIGRPGLDMWPGQADGGNTGLFLTYLKASRSPQAMRQLIASRDEAFAPSA